MERVEKFLACVKEALSQLCAEGTDVFLTIRAVRKHLLSSCVVLDLC